MISYLKGKVLALFDREVLVENQNIGYLVLVPARVLPALSPEANIELYLYPSLDSRNSKMELFGFLSKEELDFFKKLIDISGVGPRLALTILSVAAVDECVQAIEREQVDVFLRGPGVGRKTAQKIILELKGKLEHGIGTSGRDDLGRALLSLGYSKGEIQEIYGSVAAGLPLAERLKHALKLLGSRK